jgi:glutamate 5-kinase
VQGTVVIDAKAGRALRKQCRALLTTDVLGCAGEFRAGDHVYIVVRGVDGGQGVIATGIVRYDQPALMQVKGQSIDPHEVPNAGNDPAVVILEQDLRLLWPNAP